MGLPCPICGAKDGSCGDTPLAFDPINFPGRNAVANENKVYLPQQSTRRGQSGYKTGPNTVVVDANGRVVKQPEKK